MNSINHPSYYNEGKVEVINIIEGLGIGFGFCLGNAIKYLLRYKQKGNDEAEELRKALWYLKRIIDKGYYPTKYPQVRTYIFPEDALEDRELDLVIIDILHSLLVCFREDCSKRSLENQVETNLYISMVNLEHYILANYGTVSS